MNNDKQDWFPNWLGVTSEDVVWYHGGICYNRIVVRSKSAAERVAKAVAGQTVNGGWFHDMPLGGISKHQDGFEVMC